MAWELTLDELRQLSEGLGFDAIGTTTADPFPALREQLNAYADRGRTGFEWEDVEARVDPRHWLPEAKSIIAVAMAYLTPRGREVARRHPRSAARGQMSVYTYGRDYHHVISERLEDLRRRIEAHLGRPVIARPAVDTSPLVDRAVAERAGIGWVGHNCHLFTDSHGSFVFLGALLIDVAIEPAAEVRESRCGSCRLCLQACPTGALMAPGVIDAKRCLSYITQMKGIIPREFRRAMGRRIWGCDICQWVCPENRGVASADHPEYVPDEELAYPDLIRVLHMSSREFQRRAGASAAAWRGVRTWQRNALIALGNLRDARAIDEIIPFLRHARPELRASAAWALEQIGGEAARAAVAAAYAVETDPDVREEMRWAVKEEMEDGRLDDGGGNRAGQAVGARLGGGCDGGALAERG
ncbi:MAG: tRNA epoxyqueuosine(34) reductase QueG [Thermoflavifilum sp.]|nr:tRNA epoxyqueuosine(34) reductase QueG [Thermoflavifilum sp.]MCL6514207.1 tRNA epoxyqueuosine(34) reductase QueG [Alicyclobacillus sp.]